MKPMAQFGKNVWLREDGVGSFASRMTQGIIVGHHDRTGAVLCVTNNGVVRGKSWTRQPLNDAWDSTNWDGLCGTPWQMGVLELKLTQRKSQLTMKEHDIHCHGFWWKEFRRQNQQDSTCCFADIEACGHTGGCLGCAALASHGKATNAENESEQSLREP